MINEYQLMYYEISKFLLKFHISSISNSFLLDFRQLAMVEFHLFILYNYHIRKCRPTGKSELI